MVDVESCVCLGGICLGDVSVLRLVLRFVANWMSSGRGEHMFLFWILYALS